jgi:hypothetical protein
MNSSNAQEVARQLNEDPALARKRRMELRRTVLQGGNDADGVGFKRQKLPDFGSDDDDNVSAVSATTSSSTVTSGTRKTPSLRGIKKQARYEPGVPMSRGELTEWRKEARRVRNRESAAASRAKTRERIEELEGELAFLRSKYVTALDRIVQLESTSFHEAFTPSILRQDLMEQRQTVVSPSSSPLPSPEHCTTSQFPQDSFSLDACHHEDDPGTYQHIMGMISRPTAVCV